MTHPGTEQRFRLAGVTYAAVEWASNRGGKCDACAFANRHADCVDSVPPCSAHRRIDGKNVVYKEDDN